MSKGSPNVLHVGSGFRPLRSGGLVAYIEDLAAEQARRGWRVSYLFSGRYYRRPRRLRLKRWSRGGIAMLEVVNSPLHDHGRQPELELSEPGVERIFAEVLQQLRPDVVHVQELAGLPFSLLALARRAGVPVVMTLQDYFPLCPAFKLLDSAGQVCLRRQIGEDCRATLAADPRRPSLMFEATLRHHLAATPLVQRLSPARAERLTRTLARPKLVAPRAAQRAPLASAAAFQRRRDVGLQLLNDTDRLIAMSRRVREIYEELGVDGDRLTTMQLTLSHIERLAPRRREPGRTLTFATLGGGESEPKGTSVLLDALAALSARLEPGAFRLLILGRCDPEFEEAASAFPEFERRPPYQPERLDEMLEEVDVGLMPSIWEEAYGYAGIEFIAKGIPVIANPIGGMPDYVRPGETGWLNRASTGSALAESMLELIGDPGRVADVTRRTRAARGEMIVTISDHADAVEVLYREVGASV